MKRTQWTAAEIAVLRTLYADHQTAEIARRLERPIGAVYQKANGLGLKKSTTFLVSEASGRMNSATKNPAMIASRFKPGHKTWNAGMTGWQAPGVEHTQFKPGNRPHTWVPVGTYRLNHDGQLEQKVGEAKGSPGLRWHSVARLVWEAANGPMPKGHIVIFRPGQRTAVLELITLDRLECISRAEHARRNHARNISPELAKLVQLKGCIARQVNRITQESRAAA